jgi:uncharacterized protein (DUF1697 family)
MRAGRPVDVQRFAAFLRGVSPTNASMPALRAAFEAAGFEDVRTVLSSGNVVFSARAAPERVLAERAEAAMRERLGSGFLTIVRSTDALRRMLDSDPYARFRLRPGAKRVVTFFRERPKVRVELPVELHGARILCMDGGQAYSAYVPEPRRGAVFMTLIEKTFGKDVTTRTWETVRKVAT